MEIGNVALQQLGCVAAGIDGDEDRLHLSGPRRIPRLELPQPTVSRHLAYLRRAGLVDVRRDGVWMHYQVARSLDPAVQTVLNAAVEALTDIRTTTEDRKQFQRAFGQLYVMSTPSGGACCAPRA